MLRRLIGGEARLLGGLDGCVRRALGPLQRALQSLAFHYDTPSVGSASARIADARSRRRR